MPVGGASAGEGLRLQPAQQACFLALHGRIKSSLKYVLKFNFGHLYWPLHCGDKHFYNKTKLKIYVGGTANVRGETNKWTSGRMEDNHN